MFQTYLNNIGLGGLIGFVHWLLSADHYSIYGVILITLMILSFAARLIIAKNFPPIQLKSASIINALFIAPIFLYAAFADFMVVITSLTLLSIINNPDENLYVIVVLSGVFGSIWIIFQEAKLTFKRDNQSTPKWTLFLSRIILFLYCSIAVSLIWNTLGNRILEAFKTEELGLGVFYTFIFYFLAIIPFQRHAFLESMVRGKSIIHYFLSLIIGFCFVAWSVFS